jgi:hypothetical protein
MATNPRKRQQKLERRAAKRKEHKHQAARRQQALPLERLAASAKFPVLHAWVSDNVWNEGMGWVLLSRLLPDGSVAAGVFLLDRYCLGVKDALAEILPRSTYDDKFVRKMRGQFTSQDVTPAAARKLVEDAVAYAADLGFPPHADYHKAKLVFGDIDPRECTEQFEFGKDGKPYFFAGPHDGPERCRQILGILLGKCGPGGFDYVIPLGEPERYVPQALLERQARAIGDGGVAD